MAQNIGEFRDVVTYYKVTNIRNSEGVNHKSKTLICKSGAKVDETYASEAVEDNNIVSVHALEVISYAVDITNADILEYRGKSYDINSVNPITGTPFMRVEATEAWM